jgi:hypothetical protein
MTDITAGAFRSDNLGHGGKGGTGGAGGKGGKGNPDGQGGAGGDGGVGGVGGDAVPCDDSRGWIQRMGDFKKQYPGAYRFIMWDTIVSTFLLLVQVANWHG